LFRALWRIGRIDSVQLAEVLDSQTSALSGLLTTPLSRRAKELGLPLPFQASRVPGVRRRIWKDHAGVAARMSVAIHHEITARKTGTRRSSD